MRHVRLPGMRELAASLMSKALGRSMYVEVRPPVAGRCFIWEALPDYGEGQAATIVTYALTGLAGRGVLGKTRISWNWSGGGTSWPASNRRSVVVARRIARRRCRKGMSPDRSSSASACGAAAPLSASSRHER